MTTLHHEIHVDAPPEKVWAVLADLRAVAAYNPGVATADFASDSHEGVGASRRCAMKDGSAVTERVTVWEANRALGIEIAASDWPIVFMHWRTDLAPADGGTQITQDLEYRLKFGPLGALLDRLVMRRRLDGSIAEVFRSLKRHVEG